MMTSVYGESEAVPSYLLLKREDKASDDVIHKGAGYQLSDFTVQLKVGRLSS